MGDEPFIVYLGDNLLKNGIRAIPKKMMEEKADCVISLMPVKEPQRYGIAELSEDGLHVIRTVEKPKEPKSNLAVIGVYAFNRRFFEVYPKLKPSWRNEMEITDAISLLIDSGFKVVPHRVEGWWKDTGKPEDILEANHLILDGIESRNEGKVEDGATVVGRVRIGKGTVIFGRSVVRGPCIIGEDCKIGPERVHRAVHGGRGLVCRYLQGGGRRLDRDGGIDRRRGAEARQEHDREGVEDTERERACSRRGRG